MGGPKVQRSPVNTAPIPGLQQPTNDFLMQLLTGSSGGTAPTTINPMGVPITFGGTPGQGVPGANIMERMGFMTGMQPVQASDLQRQVGNTYSQLLKGPTAQERAFEVALPQIMAQLTGVPGMDVVNAAQPVYQQNLLDSLSRQRQFGGPRFAAESGRQARELEQRSTNDFNLFMQQVMEQGRQRQLQAAGVLGGLGGGADASRLGLTQGAGQYALGEGQFNLANQQMQQQMLQYLLNTAFTAGGYNAAPVITESPGFFGNLMSGLGTIGGLASGFGFNPFSGLGGGTQVSTANPGQTSDPVEISKQMDTRNKRSRK